MSSKGEYLFGSFQEAYDYLCRPTKYERDNNISITEHHLRVNWQDLKVTERVTSDKRRMLIIFFKNSKYFDIWKFWVPSEEQMEFLEHICPMIVKYINKMNQG